MTATIHLAGRTRDGAHRCLRCDTVICPVAGDVRVGARLVIGADGQQLPPGGTAAADCDLAPYLPSEVLLSTMLVGTLGRSEMEQAAMLLVLGCQANGDTWAHLRLYDMHATISRTMDAVPWVANLARNPFMRPDFAGLISRGLAITGGTPPTHTMALTVKALLAMLPAVYRGVNLRTAILPPAPAAPSTPVPA